MLKLPLGNASKTAFKGQTLEQQVASIDVRHNYRTAAAIDYLPTI